jgi:ribosomal protein S18 acetylase RimI-like enzyme
VAGYVALGTFDDPARGTIIHIGVVPEQRGRGYVDELLRACNDAALRRNFDLVLSDVDVENRPMQAAMERAAHHAAATPWHVHHYRLELR